MEKGKYDIDELVNSLLMERQNGRSADRWTTPSQEEYRPGAEAPAYMDDPIVADDADREDDEPIELLVSFEEDEEAAFSKTEVDDVLAALTTKEAEQPVYAQQPIAVEQPVSEEQSVAEEQPSVEETSVIEPNGFDIAEDVNPEFDDVFAAMPQVAPEMPKKRKKWFARKTEDTATLERSWSDWGITPIGHNRANEAEMADAEVAEDREIASSPTEIVPIVDAVERFSMPEEFPAVAPVAHGDEIRGSLPRDEGDTRVIPSSGMEPQPQPQPVAESIIDADEQLPDQLSLEEIARVEDIETDDEAEQPETEDLDPEERLMRLREEKVREFTLNGDEEEENEPDEEMPEEEEAEIEDYTGYQDTQTVSDELKYRCRTSLWSMILSGVLEFGLLMITLLTVMVEQPPIPATGYLILHLFGLLLIMGLNYSTITRGLSGLFTLRANNDTAPALAAVVCLVDVILHLLNPAIRLPFWTPLAGMVMVLSAASHYAREVCVNRNFSFVSYPGDKYAAAVIEEEGALQEIGRRAVSEGEASVAYFRRTGFLTDFLANAYDEDRGDDWSRLLTPAALGMSLVMSLLSLLGESVANAWDWLSVFTGMVCISMPVTLLAVQMPLSSTCRRMLSRGGFLNGWKAVRCFGNPDALVVDVADLYPDESMKLHGIKTFSGAHIDEALLTAASLVVRSGGPLAMIFRRIIENKEDLLYEVDSLVYEQGMGLSGWVDGRRVFVGNGRLLQNHGVDVPSSDYEARYMKDSRRLVYLAIGGQLSAMFVVSYLPDPDIQAALQDLCRSRVTLLVRSCDPNITTSDLCDCFDLDEYYVDVLPAAAGRQYMQLTENPADTLPAVMASNGHILGMARVLFACRGIQAKTMIALMVQTVAAALGILLCLWWSIQGTLSLFQPLALMILSLLVTWLAPLFRRA